jgi:3'-phosphoadenosine 5'-phosphosulfate sulfotransferase (PAPS reductase)/FAD synthetase
MLHLVRRFCKNTKVIFANTQCEYPETYKYRDEMLKGDFKDINYFETKPIKNFWQCVKEYGFPANREWDTKKGEKSKRTPKCCIYLKEKPMHLKQKELGVDCVFVGLQATESMNRRLLFLRLGERYFKKTEDKWFVLPLAIWKNEDIWAYAKKENLPMNPIYKIMERNGCMFCTGFKKWKEVMAKYNKGIYKEILKKRDGQSIIQDCFRG